MPPKVLIFTRTVFLLSLSLAMEKIFAKEEYFLYYKMYVTLKLDDSGCRIHSISDGNEEIVTNERYVVMPWKMVTRHGKKRDPQRGS